MKDFIKSILKKMIKGKDVTDELSTAADVYLLIKMNSKTIAKLYFDKNDKKFCLIYTDAFLESGLTPFHHANSDKNDAIEIGKIYSNKTLWYPFALRIPNPDRRDYEFAMKEAGLTGDESPLEIMGRISNYSISKPWKIEVLENGNLNLLKQA